MWPTCSLPGTASSNLPLLDGTYTATTIHRPFRSSFSFVLGRVRKRAFSRKGEREGVDWSPHQLFFDCSEPVFSWECCWQM